MINYRKAFEIIRRSKSIPRVFLTIACLFLAAGCSFALNPTSLDVDPVLLPGVTGGLPFNDLLFDARLGKVIVPTAGTGRLALINPETFEIQMIEGVSPGGENPDPDGFTSAAAVRGLIFAVDKSEQQIQVIDPASGSVIGTAAVEAAPEYIRFVPATNELWVTEPEKEQIEVFTAPTEDPFNPTQVDIIPVPKGPVGLIVDRTRGLAFTNQPEIGMTMVIQVQTHGPLDQWGNGCSQARGLALDEDRGYLFVGCGEGKVVMMDSSDSGNQITSQTYGGGIDAIAYNPRLQHIYLPSGGSAILAIFGVTRSVPGTATPSEAESTPTPENPTPGETIALVRLGTVDTALNADCVTVDDIDGIWVCDPSNGQLLMARDTFPASDAGS
jgi:hypothetical protein